MKTFIKPIPEFQENIFFAPIREKRHYARLLVLSARNLLLDFESFGITPKGESKMKLVIDKMSRLFYFKDNKYYSISFPFTVSIDNDQIVGISTFTGKTVDSKSISAVLSILDEEQFGLNPSLLDLYIASNDLSYIGVELLEEIFQSEPGYIRFDNDPKNVNAKIHPLNHLDVNYSSYSTYKLGLSKMIVESYFENIFDISTDCSFLVD